MIRALIFDFDGLVLDTEVPDYQSWQEIYQSFGCSLPLSAWATCIGSGPAFFDPCGYLEAQLGRPVNREDIRSKQRQRSVGLIEAQSILPGVEAYIADAKRLSLKLGLASSSSRDWVMGHLSRLGLQAHFDCIKSADDVEHTKPDPELYCSALDALNLLADQAIALEDSPNGISAAKRAGLYCVAVPNPLTRQLALEQADLQVASLADLPLEELLLKVQSKGR